MEAISAANIGSERTSIEAWKDFIYDNIPEGSDIKLSYYNMRFVITLRPVVTYLDIDVRIPEADIYYEKLIKNFTDDLLKRLPFKMSDEYISCNDLLIFINYKPGRALSTALIEIMEEQRMPTNIEPRI